MAWKKLALSVDAIPIFFSPEYIILPFNAFFTIFTV